MSYSSQALLSNDTDFRDRIAACAAVEVPQTHLPIQWANDHIWWVAASPGFADAYQYALDTAVERPGNNSAVITDTQILAAVQALLVPEEPAP